MKNLIKKFALPLLAISILFTGTFQPDAVYAAKKEEVCKDKKGKKVECPKVTKVKSSLPFENAGTPTEIEDRQYGQTKDAAKQSIKDLTGGSDQIIVDMDGVESFRNKVLNFMEIIVALIFGFAVITVVFSGFKIATSEGDSRKVKEAQIQIIAAGIGIGIAVLAKVIIEFFQQVLTISV